MGDVALNRGSAMDAYTIEPGAIDTEQSRTRIIDVFRMIDQGVKAKMLLCDAAQVQGGKLYVLGGGWSRVIALGPVSVTLAVQLLVPWHSANKRMRLKVALLDDNGAPVRAPDGQPIAVEGDMEVGRPPGLRQGSTLDSAMAVPVQGLEVPPGVYRWDLSIDNEVIETVAFEVVTPRPGLAEALRPGAS